MMFLHVITPHLYHTTHESPCNMHGLVRLFTNRPTDSYSRLFIANVCNSSTAL